MTEFKNTEHELRKFRLRITAAVAFVLICFGLLGARFIWLQVVRHDAYAAQAEDNRISLVPVVPNRGLIMDRNGVILARNYSAYTLEITRSKIKGDLESVIDDLAQIVNITPKDRRRFKKMLEDSKSFASLPIRTRLSDEEVARFTAQRYRFPGIDVQARLFRQYPLGEVAAHVIGYIGRINQKDADRIDDSEDAANYKGTSYIGKDGLEKSYEQQLHGNTGYEENRDRRQRPRSAQHVARVGDTGQQPDPVDRYRTAEGGRRSVRRSARRAGGDRTVHRRRAGVCLAAVVRPQSVC